MVEPNRFILKTLELSNYRCFPELALHFHDRVTVFVAPNGGGKTAVLDGVVAALRLFVDTVEGRTASKGFDPSDIRLVLSPENKMEPVTPVRLNAQGQFLGREIAWARERHSAEASRTTTAEAQDLKQMASLLATENQEWAQEKAATAPLFPLISYYGTGRLWSPGKLTEGKRTREIAPNARHRGYTDCLSSASHYKYFIDWFRRFSYEAKQEGGGDAPSPHHPQKPLGTVRQAVDVALKPSGWHTLEWDFAEDKVRASHDTFGQLLVDSLSDGIRNMIGLVADIAHRAARLNPHLGEDAATGTPGIVLIDEVDMHLHPEWQQVVLQSLQEAFPLVQFIVTTHSPQVLTTVSAECIQMLSQTSAGAWVAGSPGEQTRGIESAQVLAMVMNTDPIPPVAEAQWVGEYRALIQQHRLDSPEATSLRSRLEGHFGSHHPVVLECDRLIRLEEFKKNLPSGAKRRPE
jgi:predicted ATP-binding protein involved in virulence